MATSPRSTTISWLRIVGISLAAIALIAAPRLVFAQNATLTNLHSLTTQEGSTPYGKLVQGSDGNFYGTTTAGGSNGYGTVFRISPAGAFTLLHTFSVLEGTNPYGGLIRGNDGNFYGTASQNGANSAGTIFRITLDGTVTVLFNFGIDTGYNPFAGLTLGNDGSFYGTTVNGGAGGGTIFRINSGGNFTAIHTFNGSNEGLYAYSSLVQGSDGNFYGTTLSSGGDTGTGSVFRVTPAGNLTTLHVFGSGEGINPYGGVVQGNDGAFYGTTISGGTAGSGTVFRITADGTFTTIHNFSGSEGDSLHAGLIQGSDGNFYGVATSGGNGAGTIFRITPAGDVTILRSLISAEGTFPYSSLVQGSDGSFYGTTSSGGANGNGTIFRLSLNATAAPVITSATSAFAQVGQPFSYQITATNSPTSFGANGLPSGLSIDTKTGLITGTVSSAGDYFFDVSATNVGGTGMVSVGLNVSTAPLTQPTITIDSPPDNITVVSGTTLSLAASVNDPAGILSRVRFLLNGALVSTATSSGPFVGTGTAPAPGTYTLTAVAIDTQGRQSSSTRVVTVVAPDPANPVPSADILTPLNGRALAAGTIVTITAAADAENLDHVDFYADGVIFASIDGAGNLITRGLTPASGERPTRRDTPNPTGGTIFQAGFQLPNSNKLVNIFSVAISKLGKAQVSKALTVQSVANAADRPPRVTVGGLSNKQRVKVGATINLPVNATDPDAGNASVAPNGATRPIRRVFETSSVIAKVESFINGLKVKESTSAPFNFDFTPPAAGKYVLTSVATDGAGLATVSEPITVTAGVVSTVTITALSDSYAVEGGQKAKVRFTRPDDDLSGDLTVFYQLKGTAINGKDYRGLDNLPLSGSIVIPAGSDSVKLKIQARDDNKQEVTETIKLTLLPSPTDDYEIGESTKAKLFILDND